MGIDGEQPPHDYTWSLCSNDVKKTGCDTDGVMVAQTSRTYADECHVLGRWDESIKPTYTELYDANGDDVGTWAFRYDNGDSDCGNPARTWAPTFVCDPTAELEFGTVSEIPGSCLYEMTLRTKYACANAPTCGGGGDGDCTPVYTVKVVDAHNLPKMDWLSANDPYVEIYAYMSQDGTPTGSFQKVSTTIKDNTADPIWLEEFKFDEGDIDDSMAYVGFVFKLFDDDKILGVGGADFLGETGLYFTEDVTDCNWIYSKKMTVKTDTEVDGSLFIEVTMDGCCNQSNK